ncbi:hypothetical protein FRC03_007738, partial [Tulasnella sp. 419]
MPGTATTQRTALNLDHQSHTHEMSDIPRFHGDESPEDAQKWLEQLVAHTGNFSNSGMFRLLVSKFPVGSPARKWYDELDNSVKSSWVDFEHKFTDRWIAESLRRAEAEVAWKEFGSHSLKDEDIFTPEITTTEEAIHNLCAWVLEHRLLGGASRRDDATLITTTNRLLPYFIRAYLIVYYDQEGRSYDGFDGYCAAISSIPQQEVDAERIRRQLASRDLISAMQKKLDEISEKVDGLMKKANQGRYKNLAIPTLAERRPQSSFPDTSNGSIAWEPCSPLTSVAPNTEASSTTTSSPNTPVRMSLTLVSDSEDFNHEYGEPSITNDENSASDNLVEELGDGYSHVIPKIWRKPTTSMTKTQRISITKKAIDFILKFDQKVQSSQAYSLESAFAIYHKLIGSQETLRSITHDSEKDDQYERLLGGLLGINNYCTYEAPSRLASPIRTWETIVNG